MPKDEQQNDTEYTIDTLRKHLFGTLQDLRDTENPMDVERAKAIKGVANEIINTAKVDLKFIELTGFGNDSFIGGAKRLEAPDSKKK